PPMPRRPSPSLPAAALLGFASGLRTFTGPAALAHSRRLGGGDRVARGLTVAAAGELVGDKLPAVPARTAPGPLAERVVAGALVGHVAAGPAGAALGAAAAVAGAFGGRWA